MNAVIYVGPQDEAVVDLASVASRFTERTGVPIEFTRMVVKPKMLGRRPLLVIDGGAILDA